MTALLLFTLMTCLICGVCGAHLIIEAAELFKHHG